MKGIILAGGSGTRLYPITKAISKQLLLVYDKPMIYYPLSILMLSSIKEILVISTPEHIDLYKCLLNDGSDFGLNITYMVQDEPKGLADAFLIGEEFIGDDDVCLILGDNIFYGIGFGALMGDIKNSINENKEAIIFGYKVKDPERYGVVEFDRDMNVISIEEKPQNPKSNYAVVGLYFYPNNVVKKAKFVKPSKRGELEITTLNEKFLNEKKLKLKKFHDGFTWLDTGTPSSMLEASNFVQTIERRQGLKICCPEEIAFKMGFISEKKLKEIVDRNPNSEYNIYLKKLLR